MGKAYHKIQIVSYSMQKVHLIMELVHSLRNILRLPELDGIQGTKPTLTLL